MPNDEVDNKQHLKLFSGLSANGFRIYSQNKID
jgi:hypothetical protein